MADKLKDFIQASKERLDREEPRSEFREALFHELYRNQNQKRAFWTPAVIKRLAIAASLCLLVVCSLLLNREAYRKPDHMSSRSPGTLKYPEPGNAVDQVSPTDQKISLPDESYIVEKKSLPAPHSNLNPQSNQVIESIQESPNTDNIQQPSLAVATQDSVRTSTQEIIVDGSAELNKNTEPVSSVMDTSNLKSKDTEPIVADLNANKPVSDQAGYTSAEHKPAQEAQDVGSYIKKGVWNFIKKKAKKITNNTIDIQSDVKNEGTALALHFKSDLIEIQKTIPLTSERD